jgi:hypothetical protein
MLAGTLVFATQPASRRWRPDRDTPRPRGGSLRSPPMRTLVLIELGLGAVFGATDVGATDVGATDVGVTAAAKVLGSIAAAGPLLGLWGVGSLLGGIAATRLGGGTRHARGLTLLLAALALGHGALILTAGSVFAIGAVLVLAGATIAPDRGHHLRAGRPGRTSRNDYGGVLMAYDGVINRSRARRSRGGRAGAERRRPGGLRLRGRSRRPRRRDRGAGST